MIRVLKILLVGIFLFLIVIWVATVFDTCSAKKVGTDNNELVENANSEDENINLDEDIFSDDSATASSGTGDTENKAETTNQSQSTDNDVEDLVDYTGTAPKSTSKTKPKTSTKSNYTAPRKANRANRTGRYMVVAGSFLIKDNADKMKRKLHNLGYNAEVVNFNLSQYYSVIAGRYSDRSSAQETVNILKRNNINSYVHKKKN